jgi:hypothetical protein
MKKTFVIISVWDLKAAELAGANFMFSLSYKGRISYDIILPPAREWVRLA